MGTIMPGWGCEREKCSAVAAKLKGQKRQRGNTAQQQLNDQVMERTLILEAKVDALVKHYLGDSVDPLPSAPLKDQIMDRNGE